MLAKKPFNLKLIIIIVVIILALGGAIAAWLLLSGGNPKIADIKNYYQYDDFQSADLKTDCDKTVWNVNGIDFFRGKQPAYIPVKGGENVLTTTCGGASEKYDVTISMDEALIIPIDIDAGDLDYDGDGLSNQQEQELGLATYTDDTDGDGLTDNVELVLGTDPKTKDDYNAIREFMALADNDEKTGVKLQIKGAGNVANNFIDTVELSEFSGLDFVVSSVVKITTTNTEKPTEMTLNFSDKKYSGDDYAVYQYDPRTGELVQMSDGDTGFAPNATFAVADNQTPDIKLTAADDSGRVVRVNAYNVYYFVGKKAKAPTGESTHQVGIVLDNSGSMYSCEDYQRIGAEHDLSAASLENCANLNNDPNFKRVDLMNSLVDQLDVDNIKYSVGAFTYDYCALQDWSGDKNQIKTAINSIKSTCQKFNGTNISDSVRKMAKTIDVTAWGTKYVIVLTDGQESSGLFSWVTKLSSSELKKYRENGIKIITICLGVCEPEYLQKIAADTGGKYLLASDADGLADLQELISGAIDSVDLNSDIAGMEGVVIADSGFRAEIDGFGFRNFINKARNGSCFGISKAARDVYIGSLQVEYPEVDNFQTIKLTNNNTQRLVRGNLYNIKMNDLYNTWSAFALLPPGDFRTLIDGVWTIQDKYKTELIKAGYSVSIRDASEVRKTDRLGDIDLTEKYETVVYGPDILADIKVDGNYVDDFQLMQLMARKYKDTEIIDWGGVISTLLTYYKINSSLTSNAISDVKTMQDKLASGEPLVLNMSAAGAGHSVIGEKMTKDTEQDKYFLAIYDNNHPGANRIAEMQRLRVGANADGYTFSYDGGGTQYSNMFASRFSD
jgi:hypothetical protein